MTMVQDGVEIYCLPDGASCMADEEKKSPLDIDECPMGYEECTGDCTYYTELKFQESGKELRMVKVIKYGQKRRVICKHCGAILEFEQDDLKNVQTGMNEYEQQIECPACSETVTVN